MAQDNDEPLEREARIRQLLADLVTAPDRGERVKLAQELQQVIEVLLLASRAGDHNIRLSAEEFDSLRTIGFSDEALAVAAVHPSLAANNGEAGQKHRERYLLRLVFARLIHVVEEEGEVNDHKIPRAMVERLDAFLRHMTGRQQYDYLNQEAEALIRSLPIQAEKLIWPQILIDPKRFGFALNVLIRMILTFRDFPHARLRFISFINSGRDSAQDILRDEDFGLVFERLFKPLHDALEDPYSRTVMDFRYGDNTAQDIERIFRAFHRSEKIKP